MTGRLVGRVALVTGAGRGIGRGIAQRLADEGAVVGVNDLDGTAAGVAASIEEGGGRAVSLPGDVSDSAAVAAVVDALVRETGASTSW